MTSPQVLIVSDSAEFVRETVNCWRREPDAPALTVVSSEACRQAGRIRCAITIVGPVRGGGLVLPSVTLPFDSCVCAVVETNLLRPVRSRHPNWLLIPEQPGWPEALFILTREVVRRTLAEARAADAEESDLDRRRLAVLGGSLVDARSALVNALTSLVGNADLLLLSEQPLSSESSEQARTIHAMALRLNDILRRLFVLAGDASGRRESNLETPPAHGGRNRAGTAV